MIRILLLGVGVGLLSISVTAGTYPSPKGVGEPVFTDRESPEITEPLTAVPPDSLQGVGIEPAGQTSPPDIAGTPDTTDAAAPAQDTTDTALPAQDTTDAAAPAQDTTDTAAPAQDTTTVARIAPDDPIVAMLDSLAALKVFRNLDLLSDSGVVRKHGFPPEFVPTFADSVYLARLEQMNANTPMEFVYNAWVKTYIELYGMRRRDLTERMLGLGNLYFPFFEEQLDRYNIPLEMKYLAVIESALNPTARSRAGAGGMWQFMFHTGRMYGLQVNSFVDDRNDVMLSTIAACRHLADLYEIYEDWWLVLAAYNAGPGNVNRAIRRAGGVRDYWLVRPYLPRETRNYVPAFIAVSYVMTHAEEHNLYPVPPLFSHLDTDTVMVRQQLSLRTVSDLLDIPLDQLRFLNPAFRQNIIPYREESPYALTLPTKYMGAFLANEDTIYNFQTPAQIRQEELAAQMAETTVHVVRQGDVLGSIARRYNTSVREIQQLNNLRGTLIRPGQRLIVRAPSPPPAASRSGANVHVVSRGETLGIIANRYRISVNNLMQWNNLAGTVIQPGQQLIVRPPTGS